MTADLPEVQFAAVLSDALSQALGRDITISVPPGLSKQLVEDAWLPPDCRWLGCSVFALPVDTIFRWQHITPGEPPDVIAASWLLQFNGLGYDALTRQVLHDQLATRHASPPNVIEQ